MEIEDKFNINEIEEKITKLGFEYFKRIYKTDNIILTFQRKSKHDKNGNIIKVSFIFIREKKDEKKDINKTIENERNKILMSKFSKKLKEFRYSEIVSMGVPNCTLNRIIKGKRIKNSTLEKYLEIIEDYENN